VDGKNNSQTKTRMLVFLLCLLVLCIAQRDPHAHTRKHIMQLEKEISEVEAKVWAYKGTRQEGAVITYLEVGSAFFLHCYRFFSCFSLFFFFLFFLGPERAA
jgi:hypothetical protein